MDLSAEPAKPLDIPHTSPRAKKISALRIVLLRTLGIIKRLEARIVKLRVHRDYLRSQIKELEKAEGQKWH